MLRSGNVATPAEAAASDLPERRALGTLGSLPSASVTSPVKLVMTLPAESNTVTCTGWMMLSFMASVGGAVNASLVELDPRGGAWPPLRKGAVLSHSAGARHGRHSRHPGGPAKFFPCASAA